jgi:hypothetical protein
MAKDTNTNPRTNSSTERSQVNRRSAESSIGSESTFSSIISQSLSEENREGINRILAELKDYVDRGRSYAQENPREATGLAIAAGVTAWALLATKPGRILFEGAAVVAIPYISRWLSNNMQTSH